MQAKVICSYVTATKVVVGLTAGSLAAQAVRFILMYFYESLLSHTVGAYGVVLLVIVPVAVLIINLIVVYEARRAAKIAVTSLARHQSPQSTSYNSAVPTIMLLSTSFIYVLLYGPQCVLGVVYLWLSETVRCSDAWLIAYQSFVVTWAITQPIYAYNIFVYIVTGHRFRSELRQLFHCCRKTSVFSGANAATEVATDELSMQERVSYNTIQ